MRHIEILYFEQWSKRETDQQLDNQGEWPPDNLHTSRRQSFIEHTTVEAFRFTLTIDRSVTKMVQPTAWQVFPAESREL